MDVVCAARHCLCTARYCVDKSSIFWELLWLMLQGYLACWENAQAAKRIVNGPKITNCFGVKANSARSQLFAWFLAPSCLPWTQWHFQPFHHGLHKDEELILLTLSVHKYLREASLLEEQMHQGNSGSAAKSARMPQPPRPGKTGARNKTSRRSLLSSWSVNTYFFVVSTHRSEHVIVIFLFLPGGARSNSSFTICRQPLVA